MKAIVSFLAHFYRTCYELAPILTITATILVTIVIADQIVGITGWLFDNHSLHQVERLESRGAAQEKVASRFLGQAEAFRQAAEDYIIEAEKLAYQRQRLAEQERALRQATEKAQKEYAQAKTKTTSAAQRVTVVRITPLHNTQLGAVQRELDELYPDH